MRAGDEAEFRIPPEEGFGEPQDDNIQFISRADFDDNAPLEPGMLFTFADAAGGEVPGMIAEVDVSRSRWTSIILSGRTIQFKVRIAHVEPAELLMDIVLANPRGFCAGRSPLFLVVAPSVFGGPHPVRHEVVHNRHVVDDLRTRGAVFVDELSEVPDDAIVIFSAHGVSERCRTRLRVAVYSLRRDLPTCHQGSCRGGGLRCCGSGMCIDWLRSPRGWRHDERSMTPLKAAQSIFEDEHQAAALDVRDPESLAFVTQTTLSVDDTAKVIDALREQFPEIQGPRKDDICYATQNRQDAVKSLAELIWCWSSGQQIARTLTGSRWLTCGANAYLIDDASMINPTGSKLPKMLA